MKISELQARQGSVEVEGIIKDISEPREFEKFGKKGKVANAQLQDESGQVKLSLWNEQIDQVKVGYRVKISKGYVSEWQGELQLTTGKFGVLEVVGEDSAPVTPSDEEVTPDEKEEAEVLSPAEDVPKEEAVTEDNKVEVDSAPANLDVEEEEIK